ncbi:MAG: hypothetical protein AB7Q00_07720 [Phycisphaerales bacterium]|nr:MAG: hypothetical protein IPK69_12390 [Phycisphaerales bacterium]
MPDEPQAPRRMPPEPTVWDNLRRKLPYYLIGLAIGFVMLGFIRMGHEKARRAEQMNATPPVAPLPETPASGTMTPSDAKRIVPAR